MVTSIIRLSISASTNFLFFIVLSFQLYYNYRFIAIHRCHHGYLSYAARPGLFAACSDNTGSG